MGCEWILNEDFASFSHFSHPLVFTLELQLLAFFSKLTLQGKHVSVLKTFFSLSRREPETSSARCLTPGYTFLWFQH